MASHDHNIDESRYRVVIFGSARIQKGDGLYTEVHDLAKRLGEKGMDVVTGGGPGLMEAANAGHGDGVKKGGAESIGLNIKLPHEQGFNKHLDIKEEFERFSGRLDHFMYLANAVVVAPGGVGTLLEFAYTWQLMQVKHICNMPIILLGEMWGGLLEWIKENPLERSFLDQDDYDLLFTAKNSDEAFEIIKEAYDGFKEGSENFCLNYEKYKPE